MKWNDEIRGSYGRELDGARIILAMTGSVAVLRVVELARLLTRHGATIIPVMSRAATELVGPRLVHWATGMQPILELTGRNEHVLYAGNGDRPADMLLVAPATANTIGKIAAAIDDTPITTFATVAIGQGVPVLVAPAMHAPMAHHPGVQRNLATLREFGVTVIPPVPAEGKAKMASSERVLDETIRTFSTGRLRGKRVLVTAGRTVEYIDPVRVITNNSSGKMGVALARAAYHAGAQVTLVYGKGTVDPPEAVDLVRVETADAMHDAVMRHVGDPTEPIDAVIAAAAVGDWKVEEKARKKLATADTKKLELGLVPTPKIIDSIKATSPDTRLVAFRAQHDMTRDDLLADARGRMEKARADMIAVNDVSLAGAGFETDTNAMSIIHSDGTTLDIPLSSKLYVAGRIVEELAKVLECP